MCKNKVMGIKDWKILKTPQELEREALQKEIEAMEFRKRSLLNGLDGEVEALNREVTKHCTEMGQKIYIQHTQKAPLAEGIESFLDSIDKLNEEIGAKLKKKEELTKRYDEEIAIMAQDLQSRYPTPMLVNESSPSSTQEWCPNCGASYDPQESVFCPSCGCRLD